MRMESWMTERHGRCFLGNQSAVGNCYASRQTYIEVKDTYSEGGTHKETLCPQSKAGVMNKRQGD